MKRNSIRRWSAVWGFLFVLAAMSPAGAQVLGFDLPSAESAILIEASTGQILFEKNSDEPLPPASMTKLMTLLLVFEHVEAGRLQWDDRVRTSAAAARTEGSQIWLAEGDTLSLEQLARAIAIQSANDASVAVAEFVGGTVESFVAMMNRRAEELGLTNTTYTNPHGLPNGTGTTLSSARDLALVGSTLVTNFPQILVWTSQFRSPLGPGTTNPITLENTNRLILDYEGMDGLKTGHTDEAGYGLVATAMRNDRRLVSVVMRTESESARTLATTRLLDYGFRAFDWEAVLLPDRAAGIVPVPDGVPQEVEVRTEEVVRVLVPRGGSFTHRIEQTELLDAPVLAGAPAGEAVVLVDGEEALRAPVVVARDIDQASWLVRLWRAIVSFFAGLFGGGA